MLLIAQCRDVAENLPSYLERGLPAEKRSAMDAHLQDCGACRALVQRYQKVDSLLQGTVGPATLSPGFAAETGKRLQAVAVQGQSGLFASPPPEDGAEVLAPAPGFWGGFTDRFGAAPWWAVSVALHVLVIVLLSLITMSIGILEKGSGVIVLTNLEKLPAVKSEAEERKAHAALRDILDSKQETPATDPNSTVTSNIVVPPDILAQAELGDHFETINPDRPDTHSAFGNPDARMFHSASGNDEPEGGGGTGGTSLMDDLIGAGGSNSPGTGGGWGGGNGTGTGIGNGAGHGSFGQRGGGGRKLMVMRHGGSKATESTVDKALEWLARHQEAGGHWDSTKYGGKDCDLACTGFALLAFLGAGHAEKVGKYKEKVQRAVEWIIQQQTDKGCLMAKPAGSGTYVGYSHAIAGMALAEAAGMARVPRTKEAAQKAITYSVEIHQAGEGSEKRGYRYMPKQEPADLSNHGWFVMHLKSAKVAGLHIPPGGLEGAVWFLDQVEVKDPDKKADNALDYGRHRYKYSPAKDGWAASVTHRLTAIGCLNRQFMGTPKEELQGGVEWFVQKGGVPQKSKVDLYYWYYGTLCTFQQGGDLWKNWNEGLKGTLLPAQRVGGEDDGSWDPVGAYAGHWGRVGQTALSCLCLEVYYRYLPMYR